MQAKDYLGLHIRDLPYFRSLMRAVEARFYQDIDLPAPVLDVGCGDGHFATIAFDKRLDVGLDPWAGPIREASARGVYNLLTQADGGRMPFPDQYFASAISNSVLEHIPHVEAVLVETGRVLKPGAPFVFCVPNHNFLPALSIGRAIDRIGLSSLADAYRAFFNRISRHYHCDPPEVWQARLDQAGFEVARWWHYYSPRALNVSEWGHYFGLPNLVTRKLTGKWIWGPTRWSLGLIDRLIRPYYEEPPICEEGVCTFYIARRKGFQQ
jgi:ubiquinone/menaquinone biosynthesis C-methylase UbiE